MCTILFKITNLDVLRVPRVHLAHLSYHNRNWPFVQAVLSRNGFKASWTRLFFLFAIFDDISKWSTTKVLRNFEKSSNMAKFGKKWRSVFLVQICLKPIFRLISGCHSATNLGISKVNRFLERGVIRIF